MKHTLAVIVQIETNDARLDPANISVDTARAASVLRVAVLANLKRLTRVIAVLPAEQARLLMMLHEAVGDDIATFLREHGVEDADGSFARPPADYVPPTRD